MSKQREDALYEILMDLMKDGLISKAKAPYAAPALLTPKPDGTWRFVVDYKKLNNVTIEDQFPLPNMEQTVQRLGDGYKIFTKLDLKSGFWQIPIKEQDRPKTAFITSFGLFQFNVLPQVLMNSPPTFQRVMSTVLQTCRSYCQVYLDDIVVFSRSIEEHVQHLYQVLECLLQNNLKLNPPKCTIAQPKIDYLGHTITETTVTPLNDKINAILRLKEPRTLEEANHFLGAIAWYRKFIPKFAEIAAPIHAVTNLTKKNRHKFKWQEQQSNSFYELQEKLTTAPLLLQFPNDKYPLILSTDASNKGIGGVLRQEIDGKVYNIYYHSQVITKTERNYDTIEKEALAIWRCFERMRTYIIGRPIIIYTDHCPLYHMMEKNVKNKRVDRISLLLQEYNIQQVIHIKGRHNCLPDYLSRNPIQEEDELMNTDYRLKINARTSAVVEVTTRSAAKAQKTLTVQPTTINNSNLDIDDEKIAPLIDHFDITQLRTSE
ncbi:unnamed protein product [Didymodactylos carnosus]|uniref:Reverse transcriptase domain-containing protein n=1 Tax=Didymodactylos carnosus TaxID=1234261 RepID=A0A815RQX9_9BILA|nr:unnamed protein product [Didymodactylos carnosus]CAF0823414.1 unnamed protein product [Didymodactylos carnosus]CAF1480112.1 unnamed protein product [Didymodactylos carnosus]CAF3607719.1 unnamed protein product [Didymodactylos carnosus]CAF3607777.1 unnamed protein product [Didymodactylos carnosus]